MNRVKVLDLDRGVAICPNINLFDEKTHLETILLTDRISDKIIPDKILSKNKKPFLPKEVTIIEPRQPLNIDCDYSQVEVLTIDSTNPDEYDTVFQIILHIQESANHLKRLELKSIGFD